MALGEGGMAAAGRNRCAFLFRSPKPGFQVFAILSIPSILELSQSSRFMDVKAESEIFQLSWRYRCQVEKQCPLGVVNLHAQALTNRSDASTTSKLSISGAKTRSYLNIDLKPFKH